MYFTWPMPGAVVVTRNFYFKDSLYVGGQHAAIDLIRTDVPTFGSPVIAIADGTAYASPIKDYYSGWHVYVEHADNWRSGYRHFKDQILPVGQPNPVKQGDLLGYANSTGTVTGPHLHFDLWNRNKLSPEAFYKVGWWAHDPELYLGQGEEDMALTAQQEADLAEAGALARWFGTKWDSPGGATNVKDAILYNAHNLGTAIFDHDPAHWQNGLFRQLVSQIVAAEVAKIPPAQVDVQGLALLQAVTAAITNEAVLDKIALAVAAKLDVKVD